MTARTFNLLLLAALALALAAGCAGEEAAPTPYGPAQVHFPEDEGAHHEAGVEWW